MPPSRSPEEIKKDIEVTRRELAASVEALAERVREAADWRARLYEHRDKVLVVSFALGLVTGRIGAGRR